MDSSCDIIPTTFIGNKKPSTTMAALSAAAGVQAAARHEQTSHLVDPDVAKLTDFFVTYALSRSSMSLGQLAFNKVGTFFPAAQNVVLKKSAPLGYLQHCAMRTLMMRQYVEEMVTAMQAENNQRVQVVIFGAGLSTLALSLRKHFGESGVTFIEVDCGEQRDIKMEALLRLRSMGAHPLRYYGHYMNGDNLHFVNCDVAQSNWQELFFSQKHAFSKNIPSIVILDSLMYLSSEEALAFMSTVREMMTEDSRLIFGLSACVQETSAFYSSLHSGASVPHKFALPPSDVPDFVSGNFYVSGKIFSRDFVAQANQAADDTKSTPQELPLENYFVLAMKKPGHQLVDARDIHTVPTLRLKVPMPAQRKKLEEEFAP
jgi:O-methyltransferase involved in polyketide biosynthesis